MTGESPLADHPSGPRLAIRVSPRASRSAVGPIRGGALVVAVTSPPVDGEANEAVVKALSEWLGVPVRALAIVRGLRGRTKLVAVTGLGAAAIEAKLRAL